ncbi:carboxymuconolactone decarboxylase family protein [Pseudonocardia nematodicida]|uniref:Carboxymuconolactone decarboxylase family protein n=1 Tax=Pseudonocardia nematodicida TaxID=1206997 RepID=A0ABV1KED9_9PSEU
MTSRSDTAAAPTDRPDRRTEVREAFLRERGFWAPVFDTILDSDPEFMAAYLDFSAAPWRRGVLEPKVKEFVYIAADAAVQHLHAVGTRNHMRSALAHGATVEEICSVLQITSLLGLQSLHMGVDALRTALAPATPDADTAHGAAPDPDAARPDRAGPGTGSPDGWPDRLAAFDPAGADAARAWRDRVLAASPLEPKVVEFVGIAVNASTCHLNEAATAAHIRAALDAGANSAEIVEVLELVAVLGIHTATMAMPLLQELSEAART